MFWLKTFGNDHFLVLVFEGNTWFPGLDVDFGLWLKAKSKIKVEVLVWKTDLELLMNLGPGVLEDLALYYHGYK